MPSKMFSYTSEIPLHAPTNFPFSETHESSAISFVFILRTMVLPYQQQGQLLTSRAASGPVNFYSVAMSRS